jgi:hypothetical protein
VWAEPARLVAGQIDHSAMQHALDRRNIGVQDVLLVDLDEIDVRRDAVIERSLYWRSPSSSMA